jgi:ABC-2 type transport system ATP-binding protein
MLFKKHIKYRARSRGMKQKVLLAAALVHDPATLFLDEPTSMLDPRAALMVKDLIKQLANGAGKDDLHLQSHSVPCGRIM